MKFKTCFLIDDDEDDQEIFNLALKEANPDVECIVANNGIEALNRLTQKEEFIPDYIFLDLNMPRMNGKECLREIKKQNHLQHIPVIIYSTSSSPHDLEETQKLGATAFLCKPPQLNALIDALAEYFPVDGTVNKKRSS